MKKVSIFWFRRDLRLDDNHGLFEALKDNENVLPLFIFDKNILDKLENKADARVEFIHDQVSKIHQELSKKGSSILVKYGEPEAIFTELSNDFEIQSVHTNRDYEPYANDRDEKVAKLLNKKDIQLHLYKDQMIFEPGEILNGSGEFYKVFTPFSKVWLSKFDPEKIKDFKPMHWKNLFQSHSLEIIQLEEMGFKKSEISIPSKTANEEVISNYHETRDFPAKNGTSRLGIHLRFGTISIRKLAVKASELNATFLNELIWREFYMMILAYNPQVVDKAFKPAYDQIPWRNDEEEFAAWCEGMTGYPIVDAGMRELNETGYMHNRVRMVVASFLTKHLLIDWRWGETYFAEKLLDYELSSNNGGWQWAAGTGTDAQPYFRVFNPTSQQEKFDKNWKYIKKWILEINSDKYPKPIVDHKFARQRAINTYKSALNQ
ncbi:deoxyribodipyrimidine photo-lyase [Algoriphagus ratkowskyi]|uniref:Deoxyribodipyrimidine photo-lyase n=1 Tax=Algoriphagus ratkowskyi TaxID=57028 RepID=A0A2W7QYT6_9BACT|nr:deoxyribodipyrimidine photo-lyase [Algoriphagus ratkowskyi]PZX53454.1 deoxyribodipyrimidine photo-lyase [Algoriphagus ratkowskyi]TXD76507.1 deoxyribodipyrimidine photo-lyase [Algoriphagus ratkowskyi]